MAVGLERFAQAVEPLPGGRGLVNAVDLVVNWARANSLWPLVYGTSCCAIEMMATGAARHDIARFGSEVFRASPRQADLIILAGTLTEKMSEHLRTLYEQMPDPKWVIAMGACTISGGPFIYDSYSVVRGADRVVPVDVYVPGCPPRPEALLHALGLLQKVIRSESIRRPRTTRPLIGSPPVDRCAADEAAWAAEEATRQAGLEPQRAAWKAANPDAKPPKAEKIEKELGPAVEARPRVRRGAAPATLWPIVSARIPEAAPHGRTPEQLDAAPALPLDIAVPPERWVDLVRLLRDDAQIACEILLQVTAVDGADRITVCAHLLSPRLGHTVFARTALDRAKPEVASLADCFAAAAWHEREVAEMFGVVFAGHPDPRRLFLPPAMDGFPLRKDYADAQRMWTRA